MNTSKPKANRTFRAAVFFPIGAAVLATAVLAGLLLDNSRQTTVVVETPVEPELGYTGFDRAVSFTAATPEPVPDPEPGSLSIATAEVGAADRELLEILRNLDPSAGVAMLNQLGYTSEQTCGAQPLIDDFAVPDDPTYAIVTPQNADRTAVDVAAAVQEYYQVMARVYRAPSLEQLFCLARVATLPKLKWQWSDLPELVARQASVEFSQPLAVQVVGLLTGHAVVVACLPAGVYGQLALDDEPIAAELLVRWAGGRWRVATAKDHPGEPCQEFIEQTRQRYASDTSDTGEGWILF